MPVYYVNRHVKTIKRVLHMHNISKYIDTYKGFNTAQNNELLNTNLIKVVRISVLYLLIYNILC